MENVKKVSYLWLIPLTLLFPMLQNITFFIRFAHLPASLLLESLWFAPIGLISGFLLIYLSRKEGDKKRKKNMVIGFMVAMPLAMFFSLFSGLILPSMFVFIVGVIPEIIGILLGYGKGFNTQLTLIVHTVMWGILFYPILAVGYFSNTPQNMLSKAFPIYIVAAVIASWVAYVKKNINAAEKIMVTPLIFAVVTFLSQIFFK